MRQAIPEPGRDPETESPEPRKSWLFAFAAFKEAAADLVAERTTYLVDSAKADTLRLLDDCEGASSIMDNYV